MHRLTILLHLLLPLLCIFPYVSSTLLEPRDICANVNAALTVNGFTYGTIIACICVGGIGALLPPFGGGTGPNAVIQAAVENQGIPDTVAALTALIGAGQSVPSCPSSSSPSARKRSPADLARHEHRCEPGLTKCGLRTGLSYAESLALATEGPTRTK
ncbi:hypothetical protein DL93DRAFT_2208377, partial [Clavulina sp. PMI_390]